MAVRGTISALGLTASVAVVLALAAQPSARSEGREARTPPDDLARELDRRFVQDVSPVLAAYCFECHAGSEVEGDMHLDRIGGIRGVLSGDVDLRLIREMVSTAQMPPKKKAQPSDHERLTVTQWLDAAIDYVLPDAPIDPGWFTVHRLNRTEYRNTLRDLLGIDPAAVDLAAKLPRDDTGYGFDNIADVLSTSPVAVEQYLAAAERAVELALGPIVAFGDHPRTLRPLEGRSGQPLPRGGFFLYSNGPAGARFVAPITGEYIVRVRAWETHGGDEPAHLSLRVGKQSIGEFDVTA